MLNLFKKKSAAPAAWSFTVPHSNNFRGYKRLKLSTYNDPEALSGIKHIAQISDIDQVRFVEIPGHNGINVFVDKFKAGTIWRDSWTDYYKAIRSEKVEKVHLNVENEAYLFIKF